MLKRTEWKFETVSKASLPVIGRYFDWLSQMLKLCDFGEGTVSKISKFGNSYKKKFSCHSILFLVKDLEKDQKSLLYYIFKAY